MRITRPLMEWRSLEMLLFLAMRTLVDLALLFLLNIMFLIWSLLLAMVGFYERREILSIYQEDQAEVRKKMFPVKSSLLVFYLPC